MQAPCGRGVGFGGVLAAVLALAAAPGLAAAVPASGGTRAMRLAQGAVAGSGGAWEGRRLAQAQDRGPHTAAGEKGGEADGASPLRWLRFSSERFRTLMRMLAARATRSTTRRAAAARAAEDARRAEEARQAAAKAAAAKAAEDARRAEEARQAAAAKTAAAKAAEDARRAEKARAAEEGRRTAEAKAAGEARHAAEAKRATKGETAVRERRRPRARCRHAGVRVRGAGWYVVQVGDTLWDIARTHYGYGKAYHRIHAANRRRIANPHLIYPCQRIYIPPARAGRATVEDLWHALAPIIRPRETGTRPPGATGDRGLTG